MFNKRTITLTQGLLLIILSLETGYAIAVTRTALVIGNSTYSFSPLINPANDATDMAKSLRELDFDVAEYINLDRVGMRMAIREFGVKLKKGGVGLFFYAGHGIQVKGKNYLIPVNSDITSEDEVVDESIDANMVLRKMESAGNDFNIVIMDACRNNPFARSFRSSEQGLARMEGPVGSIIAYSTAPGSTAADGTGRNGLYTSFLLKAMKGEGLAIEEVFKKVRNNVRAETKGKQIPWESSSLTGHFQFTESTARKGSIVTDKVSPPPPNRMSKTGHLQVIANIPGGKVFIDNIEKGIIAGNLVFNIQNLAKKEVKVHIEKNGYKSTSQRVKLEPNEWQQTYFELLPKAQNLSTERSNTIPEVTTSWAFSFSEEEEKERISDRNLMKGVAIPSSCFNQLKTKKTAVIIGESHVSGRVFPISHSTYRLHFQIINQKLRRLGLKTYTPEEINKQIAQAEISAALNNDPDAALSAAERLGANFILRGVIRSRSQINPIVNVHEVFVNMAFTLSDASGRTVADAMARSDSWSGADTLSISLELVREKANSVIRRLYRNYCKHRG